MRRAFAIIVVVACTVCTTEDLHADAPCRSLLAPNSISLRDTGLDQNRVACGVDGFGVGTRTRATTDGQDLYGALNTALLLDYRYLHLSGFEFSAGARLAHYSVPEGGSVGDGEGNVGPIFVGVLRPRKTRWWGISAVVGHQFRFEIPLSDRSYRSVTVAASPAILVTLMPSETLHLHGRLAGLLWSVVPESGPDSQAALLASSDAAYAPLSWLALTIGAEVQAGWYEVGLDHVQARGGLRVGAGSHGAVELSGGYTLLGNEVTDVVAWLGFRRSVGSKAKPKRSRLQDWAR